MLEELPIELLFFIFSKLEDLLDLKSLSEVSKRLNRKVAPFLYESILITTTRKANGILRAHQRAGVLQYTKDIRVKSEELERWFNREPKANEEILCHHWLWDDKATRYDDSDDGTGHSDEGVIGGNLTDAELVDKKRWIDTEGKAEFYAAPGFMELRKKILSILIRCKEETLRSFRWDRNDCIPPEILGEGGCLPTKQKSLKSLSIHTDCICELRDNNPQLFPKLRHLSWKNLTSMGLAKDLERLRGCLELVSHQLIYLDLAVSYWDCYLHFQVFKPDPDGKRLIFQELQHLSLTWFYLEDGGADIVADLNPATLHTLTIRGCDAEWPRFLDRLNASDTPFRLRTVEILTFQYGSEGEEYEDMTESEENEDITRFLEGCELLENLYVSVRSMKGTLELWQSLLRHRSTLKEFVYYIYPTSHTFYYYTPFSITDVSFYKPYNLESDPEWNPLAELDLEFLGLNYEYKHLIPILAPLTKVNSLRVLLIRKHPSYEIDLIKATEKLEKAANSDASDRDGDDGSDDGSDNENEDEDMFYKDYREFDRFAQWAFGPDGIRSLQMIALGDFADSIVPRARMLICPKSDPESKNVFPGKNYRLVTRQDIVQQELFRKYARAMQACPIDNVVGWMYS
ncbi:hypothetical protein FQN49_005314 [Arthroderma sp. PD_2]|nr:hypothetical protein FQN49_005314 [Arthroderma sp. PD_2]